MQRTGLIPALLGAVLCGCTTSSAVRLSQNVIMITTNADPSCGGAGAARVAQQQAAIETIRNGFDRYVVTSAAMQNNVRSYQEPPTFYAFTGTTGENGGSVINQMGFEPGQVVVTGTHDQSLTITLYHDGEPGSDKAVPARDILGPTWPALVKKGVRTC